MVVHRLSGATGHDQSRAFAQRRADRPEDVGGFGALVLRGCGSCAAARPSPSDGVLLTYTSLIRKPDFHRLAAGCLRDFCQTGGEVFLKTAAACGSWA